MKAKKAIIITAVLLFFFGFPMFGLLYFWQDMHRKMTNDAAAPVHALAVDAMQAWDDEAIGRRLGPEADYKKINQNIEAWRTKFGRLETLGPETNPRTWAHEYKDQVWNFASFDFPAKFEKGEATVRFTGSRLYFEKDWKIHDIEFLP